MYSTIVKPFVVKIGGEPIFEQSEHFDSLYKEERFKSDFNQKLMHRNNEKKRALGRILVRPGEIC